MAGSAGARLYCLIGDPVGHSLSPQIMNRAFSQLGMDAAYAALRVPSDGLPQVLADLRTLGAGGANVTFPHKEAVLPLIDHPSERTRVIGAANTLRFDAGGTWGYNTDAAGTAIALERLAGLSLAGRRVVIFGAGGAGRAASFGVLDAGAASVAFCVRSTSKAEAATALLRRSFGDGAVCLIPLDGEAARSARREAILGADVIINATPVGMAGVHGSPDAPGDGGAAGGGTPLLAASARASSTAGAAVQPAGALSPTGVPVASLLVEDPEWIRPGHCCFDFVYTPRETPFLKVARARGALCLGGVALLLAQAREAFRCWTGRAFDLEEMSAVLERQMDGASLPGRSNGRPCQ